MNNNPLPEGAIAAIKKEANGRFGYSNDSHKKMTDTLIEGAELYHKWIQQEGSSKPKEKRAPVQGYNQGIPWDMHLRAYDAYCKRYSKQDALIDLEGRNCRGGFGTEELDVFIPGWREELSERTALIKERDALQQFKDFVHNRLDQMGVPTHPEGEHSKAGCRIGDRLDIVELNYTYQYKVGQWLLACLGSEIASDSTERAFRFTEESLELVQSLGLSKAQVMQLVDYVFDRPAGVPHQEVGGVMVTLAALCSAGGLSMRQAATDEYERVLTKIDTIRAKHFSKPQNVLSPIPGNSNQ